MFFAIANTVSTLAKAVVTPIIGFIWNENVNQWEGENRNWDDNP
jgi:hypothetical protein